MQVLTAGTRYDQEKAKDGNAIPSTVVTLLVTPEDGERIALAASEGQIMLALRNPLDTEYDRDDWRSHGRLVRRASAGGEGQAGARLGASQADSTGRDRDTEAFGLYR